MKRSILFLLILISFSHAKAQEGYITKKNILYYPDSASQDAYTKERCRLDIYYPKAAKNAGTVIWFHGGGIIQGEKQLPSALMNKGYIVVGVGYRLSPKVKSPAYVEDAAAAIAWVFKHVKEYGGSNKLIFLSGHSAGGYLVLMCTLDKQYLAKYNIDANDIAETLPFSGQAITHFTIRQERGMKNTQPVIDEMAPLYWVRKDAPPLLLMTGDREMELLGRYEENAYLARMMKLAGHKRTTLYEFQGFDHGTMSAPGFPILLKEMKRRIEEINNGN
ncbi:alpha/beta hydrolase [Mucilaginibacter dorajii]|uniref:Alpha/beta hydrolase n=1 Tax=Mucilaginibacter dorajii TaxID=692994 RepID=A0ABP7QX49_9SPHI|nr:alpha/beta hydrolase [Mucilaginibacter dorajii]MCS3732434.1 acetyl esterase/lipase [Mucilaginibacter dorajii]